MREAVANLSRNRVGNWQLATTQQVTVPKRRVTLLSNTCGSVALRMERSPARARVRHLIGRGRRQWIAQAMIAG